MTERYHAGCDITVDETTANAVPVSNAAPGSSDYGLTVLRKEISNGVVPVSFSATSLAGLTAEALASITPVTDFTTGSAATAHTVPADKTFRVSGLTGNVRRTTTTGSLTWYLLINLRVNTGGTALVTSPIIASANSAWAEYSAPAATIGFGSEPIWAYFPGGIDIPAGASFGLGYVTGSSIASRATVELGMFGFYY